VNRRGLPIDFLGINPSNLVLVQNGAIEIRIVIGSFKVRLNFQPI
jgi:hypothetical protein